MDRVNPSKLPVLVVVLFIFAEFQVNGSSLSSQACTSNADCRDEAVCINSRCACPMGYLPEKKECEQVICKRDFDCSRHFENTICNSKKRCECKPAFWLEPATQKCSAVAVIGGQCDGLDEQCGDMAICVASGQCKCKLGSLPQDSRAGCVGVKCSSDSECLSHFSNTTCKSKSCICGPSFETNPDTQTCVLTKTQIGKSCSKNTQCGEGALCADSTCTCEMGSLPMTNQVDCEEFHCKIDSDCSYFANTVCMDNECECRLDYEINLDNQMCERQRPRERISLLAIVIVSVVSVLIILACIAALIFCCSCCARCCCSACCCAKPETPAPVAGTNGATSHMYHNEQMALAELYIPSAPGLSTQPKSSKNNLYPNLYEPPPPYTP